MLALGTCSHRSDGAQWQWGGRFPEVGAAALTCRLSCPWLLHEGSVWRRLGLAGPGPPHPGVAPLAAIEGRTTDRNAPFRVEGDFNGGGRLLLARQPGVAGRPDAV